MKYFLYRRKYSYVTGSNPIYIIKLRYLPTCPILLGKVTKLHRNVLHPPTYHLGESDNFEEGMEVPLSKCCLALGRAVWNCRLRLCSYSQIMSADESRAADSVALGCATLAPRLNFSTLRCSEEIFLRLVVNSTLLSRH